VTLNTPCDCLYGETVARFFLEVELAPDFSSGDFEILALALDFQPLCLPQVQFDFVGERERRSQNFACSQTVPASLAHGAYHGRNTGSPTVARIAASAKAGITHGRITKVAQRCERPCGRRPSFLVGIPDS
jgi:hypothetical protein